MDIAAWLQSLGMQQYEEAFRHNAIDAAVLPELTADDLKDLGVNLVRHRCRLLVAIAALGQRSSSASSSGRASRTYIGCRAPAAYRNVLQPGRL